MREDGRNCGTSFGGDEGQATSEQRAASSEQGAAVDGGSRGCCVVGVGPCRVMRGSRVESGISVCTAGEGKMVHCNAAIEREHWDMRRRKSAELVVWLSMLCGLPGQVTVYQAGTGTMEEAGEVLWLLPGKIPSRLPSSPCFGR